MRRRGIAFFLAAVILAVCTACGDGGSRTAKITVTYDPVWDDRETFSTQWEKTYEGEEAAELLALLEDFSYDGPPCDCLPAYFLETETGQSYGYKPGEAYVRHNGGQTQLTDSEAEKLQALFDVIAEKGEAVSRE